MRLADAFGIKPKEVIALVGGGGKTTAMFCLAEELVADGKRVVTTTTTRIFAAQIKLAPFHIFAESNRQAIRATRSALREHPHVLVVGATNQEGKAFGVDPALVDALSASDEVEVVIDEADGSRMRPFKAPGEHEPVIPRSTTLLIPVVGIDVLGKPLNDAQVHRAARVAELAQIPLDTLLEPEHLARVIAHSEGGLKYKPAAARVIPLINKVEDDVQNAQARVIAKLLLEHAAIDAVAIGAVKNTAAPLAELQQRVAAVILAAGGSTRMRGPLKQLLPWGDSTLVRHTVEVAQRAQVAEIVVVVGNRADEVEKQVEGTRARIVFNPDWASGRASSVRVGLNAIAARSAAAIFINADQPFLTPTVIDTLVQRFASTLAPIIVPTYAGVAGSPVLFARKYFGELAALAGDAGGKQLLEKNRAVVARVAIDEARAAIDVDTPDEYRDALNARHAN